MNKIRLLRTKLGLSQSRLAEKAGVGVVTIIRMESGGKVRPMTLMNIAKALEVEVDELLEFEAEGANKGKPRPPSKAKPKPTPPPPTPVAAGPVTPAKQKFSDKRQIKDNTWAVAEELGLTISQVQYRMKKTPGVSGLDYEELKKAVAEFKK
jgi:DNA-binding XRE family transcriptional regulator